MNTSLAARQEVGIEVGLEQPANMPLGVAALHGGDPLLNAAANAREGAMQQRWPKPHGICRMLSRVRTCAHGRGEGARLAQQRQTRPHTVVRAEVVCR